MKNISTYLQEGFYKTVGVDLAQIRDNFEYLKNRIFNTWGYNRKFVSHDDTFFQIIGESNFTDLPKGTIISIPYPIKDILENGTFKRGQKVTLTFKKLTDPHKNRGAYNIYDEEWYVDSPDIEEDVKKNCVFFTCRGPKRQYLGCGVIDCIIRAERFLKREELDKITIDLSL